MFGGRKASLLALIYRQRQKQPTTTTTTSSVMQHAPPPNHPHHGCTQPSGSEFRAATHHGQLRPLSVRLLYIHQHAPLSPPLPSKRKCIPPSQSQPNQTRVLFPSLCMETLNISFLKQPIATLQMCRRFNISFELVCKSVSLPFIVLRMRVNLGL